MPSELFVTRYTYDQLDRLVRGTDNAGQTTRFAYDSRNNLVHRSDPEGAPTADPLGIFPGQINAPGNTYTWFYDGANRKLRDLCDLRVGGNGSGALDTSNPFNPDGQISVSYAYDDNSRLVGVIDDNLNRTSYEYDALNRQTAQVNADGTRIETVYDRDDNVTQLTDPNGSVRVFAYDALERVIQITVARAAGIGGTSQETIGYDGLSRTTRVTDNNGAATDQSCDYVFDSLGRLLEERFNGQAVSNSFTGDGKRTRCIYPGGRQLATTYDLIDRPKATSDGSGPIATMDWIGPGLRPLRRTNGNGTVLTYLNDAGNVDQGYDAVQRVVRMRHTLGATAFVDREYSYSRANMRTLERRNDEGGATDTFTLDSAYRIVDTHYDVGAASTRDVTQASYTLDGVGNRRTVTTESASNGSTSQAHTVNEMNEYSEIGGTARTHSENGNLLDDGTRLFLYDYKDRLILVTDRATGTPIAQYLYYSNNRRAQKFVFATVATTSFYYDGWQLCEEQAPASTTYVWDSSYVDALVRIDGQGVHYVHQDVRADVVAVTDNTGAVVERRYYDDFGQAYDEAKLPTVGSSVGNPYGFQGRRLDEETGLLYYRNRYYDMATGRFLQRDRVWDPANVGNQYAFGANNPLSNMDPTGLFIESLANAYYAVRNALNTADDMRRLQRCAGGLTAEGYAQFEMGRRGMIQHGMGQLEDATQNIMRAAGELALELGAGGLLSAALPVAAAALGTGLKAAAKLGGKAAGAVGRALGTAAGKVGGAIGSTAARGAAAAAKSAFNGAKSLARGAANAARSVANKMFKKTNGKAGCFLRGTLVETVEGPAPIETVEVGDLVLSRDPATGRWAYKPVVRTFRGHTSQVLYLRVAKSSAVQRGRSEGHRVGEESGGSGEGSDEPPLTGGSQEDRVQTIRSTIEHPYMRPDGTEVPAIDLKVGDELFGSNGERLVVVGTEVRQEEADHFNFEVADFHTYFVSETEDDPAIWVHNVCRLEVLDATGGAIRQSGALKRLRAFDPDARIGIRGSTATGKVGNPRKIAQGKTDWNPNDFDLDLFIESPRLAKMMREAAAGRSAAGRGPGHTLGVDKVMDLGGLRDTLVRQRPDLFGGLRPGGKGVSVKVYDQVPSGPAVFFD